MPDEVKRTETKTRNNTVGDDGAAVQTQTSEVKTDSTADSKVTAINVIWYIFGFIAVLLGIRLVLKLFGANPNSGFVDFIYTISGILSVPFDNIFGVASTETGEVQSVFEPSIVVAILVYLLIAWGIVKLITINQKEA